LNFSVKVIRYGYAQARRLEIPFKQIVPDLDLLRDPAAVVLLLAVTSASVKAAK
jgi:hypothetical protein